MNVQVAHVKMAPSAPTQLEATSAHAWEDGLQERTVMKVSPHMHKRIPYSRRTVEEQVATEY